MRSQPETCKNKETELKARVRPLCCACLRGHHIGDARADEHDAVAQQVVVQVHRLLHSRPGAGAGSMALGPGSCWRLQTAARRLYNPPQPAPPPAGMSLLPSTSHRRWRPPTSPPSGPVMITGGMMGSTTRRPCGGGSLRCGGSAGGSAHSCCVCTATKPAPSACCKRCAFSVPSEQGFAWPSSSNTCAAVPSRHNNRLAPAAVLVLAPAPKGLARRQPRCRALLLLLLLLPRGVKGGELQRRQHLCAAEVMAGRASLCPLTPQCQLPIAPCNCVQLIGSLFRL